MSRYASSTARRDARRTLVASGLALALLLTGCAATDPAVTADETAAPGDRMTLRTLAENDEKPQLELGERTGGGSAYATRRVTYESGGITVSGSLSVPTGDGPHPGLVLAHGLVDPESYTDGSGMPREQHHFADAGYVVLSADLRSSEPGTEEVTALSIDMGATLDVINAVRALASADLPSLDEDRISLLGHSMGGVLVINAMVAQPDLVDAVVALAPASSDPIDLVEQLSSMAGGSRDRVYARFGTPEQHPEFWADLSARTFAEQAEAPLLIIHGTEDVVTPIDWSEETADAWAAAGTDVELERLDGAGHIFFDDEWREAMDATEEFFEDVL
ncbi:alpha/beta fold hydrolase [Diaminobutyricimonas sp. TR449]|uniref:alpha/beta hydrolase family protein n=1 Tax=Diaminobutyricimonas sp. TR449 TaxID=2708076 RepID=UPI001423B855|nr:alpha/beta fold hydrolase [Diaminobutyricimonas sp. TR449]